MRPAKTIPRILVVRIWLLALETGMSIRERRRGGEVMLRERDEPANNNDAQPDDHGDAAHNLGLSYARITSPRDPLPNRKRVEDGKRQDRHLEPEVEIVVVADREREELRDAGEDHHTEAADHPRPRVGVDLRDRLLGHANTQQSQVDDEHPADEEGEGQQVSDVDGGANPP